MYGIYHVYTLYIPCLYHVYTLCIHADIASRQLSSSQTCIAGLCAPVVTHSIWNAIDFGEEMSRHVHIHGICYVYNMYMSVISFEYTWTNQILLFAGLFGNYPSSSILHWRE